MKKPSRLALLAVAVLVPLVLAVVAAGSQRTVAHEGGGFTVLRTTLAPSVPTDPVFHGVAPGGVPWVLKHGSAQLKANGELELEVEGLVIPSLGNAGGVTSISASLYCGADTTTSAAASTGTVPLSPQGNAELEAHVSLPATCLAPVLLVNPNGGAARYIAVSGWKS